MESGEQGFSSLLQSNYQQNFGDKSAILGHLNSILSPIIQGGPSQKGFSAGETADLNSSAINTNAANYRNAATVVAGSRAGAGGSTYAPSGTDKQVEGSIATAAAQNLGATENQIDLANYQQGNQNYTNAVSAEEGVANAYNPDAIAGEATGANSSAANQAQTINAENQAWEGQVTGLVGGLGGAALGNPALFGGHK